MCQYCDYNSDSCCVFYDPLDGTWYFEHQTSEWDAYDDGYLTDKIRINYCPWCGKKLYADGSGRGATRHELKIMPEYFEAVISGNKKFEVRKNDRNFKVGDSLLLREYESGHYTGRECAKDILYILSDPEYVKPGYVVLSL